MQFELDAPSNDVIAMNLTIAALDRWLSTLTASSGSEIGKEIGDMYREIHLVVDEVSPNEDEEDEEEEDDEEDVVARRVAAV
ncbi:MAG TPA: hypothetical protein VNG31_04470 [Candidatus Baltobacteraceae bacterium]|nr:hypothetical protein [Candidatus Baltobacteraceae bacterium]